MGRYYAIQQAERTADIQIFGDLMQNSWYDSDVSANQILTEIKNLDVDRINVHIDSYGGSVSEGWAIYNVLLAHPAKVVTYGDGFVASAALYPFLAGDERHASTVSAYFLHEVMTYAEGYADDLKAAAEEAEKMTQIGINAFVERTGMDAGTVEKLMRGETWLTAQEALDYGIATSLDTAADKGGKTQSVKRDLIQMAITGNKEPEHEPEQNKIMNLFSAVCAKGEKKH